MTRLRSRLLVPALTLIALAFLLPPLATALPRGETILSAAERPEATPGLLSQLWSLLSPLWDENGSILNLKGVPSPTPGLPTEPDAVNSGDNGSGLDPNG